MVASRKGRSAQDPVFIEIMQNETYRASMKTGLSKDLDATSCYDRILPWIASTCSRRVGIHRMVAATNCKTLEQAEFHLKTSMDTSEDFYRHCPEYPIYGTGQGSGNSPHLWCFVASTFFDAYEECAHGASFYSYDGKEEMKTHMIGFVDDCSQRVNDFTAHPQPSAATLVEMMTKDAQLWHDLLWTSGGALEIPKCSFQIIETNWSARGRPFLQGMENAPALEIQSGNGSIKVKQISSYQARRSLGIHLSPSGMMNTQFKILEEKSKRFTELALMNALTRREAMLFYQAIYIPSIMYPLQLTYLSEGHCHGIETQFLKAILPRCGYNRNMSRQIRYASVRNGGAGFLKLFVEQQTHNIMTAMKHLRCPTAQTGQIELIALTWAQAHAGVSWPIWQFPKPKLPIIPTPWIMNIRTGLRNIEGKPILRNNQVPKPQAATPQGLVHHGHGVKKLDLHKKRDRGY